MPDRGFSNYRVKYLMGHQVSPNDKRDPVNPALWVCEDIIPANSPDMAMQQVIARGGLPVSSKRLRQFILGISEDYRIKFLMAILFAVQAGVSVGAAMERTIEGEAWPLRGHLDPALRLLKAGATFSESLELLGIYDETTLAILTAGERTGTMNQALSTALEHLQRRRTTGGLLKGAVGMIFLDILLAMSSSLSAVFVLLPQAEKQGLPIKDAMAVANWEAAIKLGYFANYILLGGAGLLLLLSVIGWLLYNYGESSIRMKIDAAMRKFPIIGEALIHEALAVSTNIASHLLKGGVLFGSAMEITVKTISQPMVSKYWETVIEMSLGGAPVAQALARQPLTAAEQRVVASHTNSLQLAEAFSQIGNFRQELAVKANKRFIVMGLVASFLYSGLGIASTLYVNYIQIKSLMSATI